MGSAPSSIASVFGSASSKASVLSSMAGMAACRASSEAGGQAAIAIVILMAGMVDVGLMGAAVLL